MYKQIIIARKDLNMSPGKLAAQVSHASMAFLTNQIRNNATKSPLSDLNDLSSYDYNVNLTFYRLQYEQWINSEFTKCILEAKNKNHLLKAVQLANQLYMEENIHYFIIKDNCHTELSPEEPDGTTITCLGFEPCNDTFINQIGKKYQLYK